MCFCLQSLHLHDIDSDWRVYSGLVLHPSRMKNKHFSTILCLIRYWNQFLFRLSSLFFRVIFLLVHVIVYLHNVATSYMHFKETTSGSCCILAFACTLLPLRSYLQWNTWYHFFTIIQVQLYLTLDCPFLHDHDIGMSCLGIKLLSYLYRGGTVNSGKQQSLTLMLPNVPVISVQRNRYH